MSAETPSLPLPLAFPLGDDPAAEADFRLFLGFFGATGVLRASSSELG